MPLGQSRHTECWAASLVTSAAGSRVWRGLNSQDELDGSLHYIQSGQPTPPHFELQRWMGVANEPSPVQVHAEGK